MTKTSPEENSKRRWKGNEPDQGLTWGHVITGDSFWEVASLLTPLSTEPIDVLEIGPGYGRLLRWLLERDRVRSYAGIELSADRVEKLRKDFANSSCEFYAMDADTFELDKAFDLFVCSATFEHLYPSFSKALERVRAHMRPGGDIIFDLLQCDDEIRLESGAFGEQPNDGAFVRVYPLDSLKKLLAEQELELCGLRSYVLPFGDQPLIVDRVKATELIRNNTGWVTIGGVTIGVERLMVHCRVPGSP